MNDYAASVGSDWSGCCNGVGLHGMVGRGSDGATLYSGKTFASIVDGTSNSVCVAEKRYNLAMRNSTQGSDNEGWTCAWDWDSIRKGTIARPPQPDLTTSGQNSFEDFGSAHVAGLNVLFGDGSVRLVRFSVTPAVWQAACEIDDGVVFSLDDL